MYKFLFTVLACIFTATLGLNTFAAAPSGSATIESDTVVAAQVLDECDDEVCDPEAPDQPESDDTESDEPEVTESM